MEGFATGKSPIPPTGDLKRAIREEGGCKTFLQITSPHPSPEGREQEGSPLNPPPRRGDFKRAVRKTVNNGGWDFSLR